MALNIATFKTRAATAGVFVVVMLVGMLWNHWTFFLLFSIIHFGCWWEYQKLVRLIDPGYARISMLHQWGIMLAGWGLLLYFTNNGFSIGEIGLQNTGKWLFVIAAILSVFGDLLLARQGILKNISHSIFGLLYISLPLGLMISIRSYGMQPGDAQDHGYLLPLGILIALWINDTMAYLVGSFIGKTPFSSISPKKTWEGTAGGAILCMLVVALAGFAIHVYTVKDWLAIGAIVAVFGVLGDLFESKLKRMAGVKDSGSIMPGHGGFLDRFDSLLIATPFVWLYIVLCMP